MGTRPDTYTHTHWMNLIASHRKKKFSKQRNNTCEKALLASPTPVMKIPKNTIMWQDPSPRVQQKKKFPTRRKKEKFK